MTLRAAVLGHPISHSKSPALHRAAYAHLGVDIAYSAIDVTEAALPDFMRQVRDQVRADGSWRGLSVTMPLKSAMVAEVDEVRGVGARTRRRQHRCLRTRRRCNTVGRLQHGRRRDRQRAPARGGRPGAHGRGPRRGRHRGSSHRGPQGTRGGVRRRVRARSQPGRRGPRGFRLPWGSPSRCFPSPVRPPPSRRRRRHLHPAAPRGRRACR